MKSELRLLTRDGLVSVVFSPQLAPDQADELMDIVRTRSFKTTSADLRKVLEAAAERWGVNVNVAVSQLAKS